MTQPQGAAHPEMFELPSAIASIFIHCGINLRVLHILRCLNFPVLLPAYSYVASHSHVPFPMSRQHTTQHSQHGSNSSQPARPIPPLQIQNIYAQRQHMAPQLPVAQQLTKESVLSPRPGHHQAAAATTQHPHQYFGPRQCHKWPVDRAIHPPQPCQHAPRHYRGARAYTRAPRVAALPAWHWGSNHLRGGHSASGGTWWTSTGEAT